MRQILFTFIFILAFGEMTFPQAGKCKGCIEWQEERALKWSDFKGRPNRLSGNEAVTDSGIAISLECNGRYSEVKVESFFDPKGSWTKDHASDYLLAHEQLHFDITELFARKLRKQLQSLGNDCKRLNSHVEQFYNKNYKAYVRYQAAYDRESNHSINRKEQQRWQKKVNAELAELSQYALLANN